MSRTAKKSAAYAAADAAAAAYADAKRNSIYVAVRETLTKLFREKLADTRALSQESAHRMVARLIAMKDEEPSL